MIKQKSIKKPVFHELQFHPGSYAKVYWPIHKKHESSTDRAYVSITNNSEYTRPNGTKIRVVSLFKGKMYPMINYTIGDSEKICVTSISWFANNIAYTKS